MNKPLACSTKVVYPLLSLEYATVNLSPALCSKYLFSSQVQKLEKKRKTYEEGQVQKKHKSR